MAQNTGTSGFYGPGIPPTPLRPADVKIGIIGGPGTGKSTYVAVLQLAAALHDPPTSLTIQAAEDLFKGSAQHLDEQTTLILERKLPPKTQVDANYGYYVGGEFASVSDFSAARVDALEPGGLIAAIMNALFGRRKLYQAPSPQRFTALLHIRDFPGEAFRETDPDDPMWEHLSTCDGFIFLFDLILENEDPPQNYPYVGKLLNYIAARQRIATGILSTDIRKDLAVCITKVDHRYVLKELVDSKHASITQDDEVKFVSTPRIAFSKLAHPLLKKAILDYFPSHRVEYFWLTNTGFNYSSLTSSDVTSLDNVFDPALDGTIGHSSEKRIKGEIRPIGVVEPFLWLLEKHFSAKKMSD